MAVSVTMPKLGLTMSSGNIAQWRKKEGDSVAKGEILFVVATDKLTFDVEAQETGILIQILVPEGKDVPVGETLAYLGEKGEHVKASAEKPGSSVGAVENPAKSPSAPFIEKTASSSTAGRVSASPLAKKTARESGLSLSGLKGTGPGGMIVRKDVAAASADAVRVKTSPVARKIADELGVNVAALDGKERIMKADVFAAARKPEDETPRTGGTRRIPVSPMRRVIGERMSESSRTIPVVTYNMEADCTALIAFRNALKESFSGNGLHLSFTHIFMKICARVLTEMPMANASIDGNEFVLHDDANIGIAVAVEGGLLVPNLKGVQKKSLSQIAGETDALVEKARSGKLGISDMQGGTFTITNLGAFGVRDFTPIINPPEACIMAMNAIVEKAVVLNGQVAIRPVTIIGLTADHRILDGADAARFLSRMKEIIENPYLLLA